MVLYLQKYLKHKKRNIFMNESYILNGKPVSADGTPTPDAPKKKKKHTGLLITLISLLIPIIIAGAVLLWLLVFTYSPKFQVNALEFDLRTTAGSLREMGFVLCNSKGEERTTNTNVYPRYIYDSKFYLYVEDDDEELRYTGLVVEFVNTSKNTKKLNECSIFELWYYPAAQSLDLDVKLDGIDLSYAVYDDDLAPLLKKSKIPFDAKEIDRFVDGDTEKLHDYNTLYAYTVNIDKNKKDVVFYFCRNEKVSH